MEIIDVSLEEHKKLREGATPIIDLRGDMVDGKMQLHCNDMDIVNFLKKYPEYGRSLIFFLSDFQRRILNLIDQLAYVKEQETETK